MARGRSASYDAMREAILAQAAALFATKGYADTSMNEVAEACGISKPTLYHYVRDKQALLAQICATHVASLAAEVSAVQALGLAPQAHLRQLIERFVEAYSAAQHQHRVLTEDVKFLAAPDREALHATERAVVTAFADAIAAVRPDVTPAGLAKPLSMLLFGMINWTYTWLRPQGSISYDSLAPIVADLFFGGIGAVTPPTPSTSKEPVS